MNKYQEALGILDANQTEFKDNRDITKRAEARLRLQELVDKATGQKKHIENCKEREYINHNYCYACGQKLDWTDTD